MSNIIDITERIAKSDMLERDIDEAKRRCMDFIADLIDENFDPDVISAAFARLGFRGDLTRR